MNSAANFMTPRTRTSSRSRSARRTGSSQSSTQQQQQQQQQQNATKYIVALCENRAKEIGFAAIDVNSPEIEIIQIAESHNYTETTRLVSLLQPVEVLFPSTAEDSHLYNIILNTFPDLQVTCIQRKYFSEERGKILLHQIVHGDFLRTGGGGELDMQAHYLCYSSSGALIKYIEYVQNFTFTNKSLKLRIRKADGIMFLDPDTIKNLELLYDTRTFEAANSLYGVMKETLTDAGDKLLRMSILQPLSDSVKIEERLDAIDELHTNDTALAGIRATIAPFRTINTVLAQFACKNTDTSIKAIQKSVKNLIVLKNYLIQCPSLQQSCTGMESGYIKALVPDLANAALVAILGSIERIINREAVHYANVQLMRSEICYAVKPEINTMLDIARIAYRESLADIHTLVEQYNAQYEDFKLKLEFSTKKGFYMSCNNTIVSLPAVFIHATRKGKKIHCSTQQLTKLTHRNQESLNEIMLMTQRVIQSLQDEIRTNITALYALIESIAQLDFIQSLATHSLSNDTYARPMFVANGPIAIQEGRHPIFEKVAMKRIVPNDTFMSPDQKTHLISGPNMSGKTTYIKQVSLIAIMAHMGCHVPARFASLPLFDRICSRLGDNIDPEMRASTFSTEMTELAFILDHATSNTLVIVDELGRGTSAVDGLSIAFAATEHMSLATKCYTFMISHYVQLANLDMMYGSVVCHSMEIRVTDYIECLYTIKKGLTACAKWYGIETAQLSGFDRATIATARQIRAQLAAPSNAAVHDMRTKQHAMIELAQKLEGLRATTLDERKVGEYLCNLKREYAGLLAVFNDAGAPGRANAATATAIATATTTVAAPVAAPIATVAAIVQTPRSSHNDVSPAAAANTTTSSNSNSTNTTTTVTTAAALMAGQ